MRSRFLEAVRSRRASFEEAAVPAEEARTLPADMVKLMRDLRLFWLKTPRELGGDELDPLEFCEVLEQLAYYDASVAWAAMVGNGTTGTVAGWLPDEGLREVFPGTGTDLPICAGQFSSRGRAVPVDGGHVVSGRWGFGSGINHADWVVGGCVVEGGAGAEILAVVPKGEATLHDTWHVAGLQGTGSYDFSMTEVFVPAGRVIEGLGTPGLRGGDLFRPPPLMFVSNELSPVAVGIARRAIDDMYDLARAATRRTGGVPVGERAAFQKDMGRAEARLRAVQVLYRDAVARVWDAARTESGLDDALVARTFAQHTYVVEECTDLVSRIFRYGGGRVLALSHPMQRHLRNLSAAMQHIYITDENYELAGKAGLDSRPSSP
ncbi:acyl-CoA dehydrogenase family protein [Actinomadura sp. SCN-SB]|uniref:acyl-CoA dehydrogenase family protein n=1 Tax=Actinomadura sp. SCN-SB TaxID=3373092 RepID=UPI00375333BB